MNIKEYITQNPNDGIIFDDKMKEIFYQRIVKDFNDTISDELFFTHTLQIDTGFSSIKKRSDIVKKFKNITCFLKDNFMITTERAIYILHKLDMFFSYNWSSSSNKKDTKIK